MSPMVSPEQRFQFPRSVENGRFCLGDRIEHGLATGGNESHFLGVNRVALTVIDDDFDVMNRITGDEPCFQGTADTLFNSRDEVVRNGAALDFVNELETFASFERFDTQINFTELAGTARSVSYGVRDLQHYRKSFRDTECAEHEYLLRA